MVEQLTGPMDVVRLACPTIAGRQVLDIGCGEGRFAGELARAGAIVTGIDPNPDAIVSARGAVAAARFEMGGAARLPFSDGSFDLAVIQNALHHVPEAEMSAALREAMRCLKPDGRLVVIEPDVTGSFFDVVKLVDDETHVRTVARKAVEQAIGGGDLTLLKRATFVRRDVFPDARAMASRIAAVDPARAPVVEQALPALAATFARVGAPCAGGFSFEQPHWAVIAGQLQ
jgi:SAM-dependent methyltransferase